ncbi:MAG: recombinase XerC, partial [Alphaproteobacteria bacterium]|nr:recombinase XerC [Alphaproteobacteria bacterium]
MRDERRASPHTIEAYGRDIADFLGFLTGYQGAEPDLAALAALRPTDLRAFLAARAGQGAGAATRARQLSTIRSFLRFLARRHGLQPLALAGLRGPRLPRPVPRAIAAEQAIALGQE